MLSVIGIFLWSSLLKISFGVLNYETTEVKSLLNDVGRINSALQSLQETVRRQDDLINDLLQHKNDQEKRIHELEKALETQVQDSRQQGRLKELKTTVDTMSVESGLTNDTNLTNRDLTLQDKKQIRKERLLSSLIPTTISANEHGIIAFYAQMLSIERSPGAHHTLIFDKVHTNAGNGYNGVTGIFTAPQEGIYVFTWVIRMVSAEHSTELMLNNDVLGATFLRAKNGDDGSVSGTVVTHVTKADVVFVRVHSQYAGDGNILSNILGQPSLSGWLLH